MIDEPIGVHTSAPNIDVLDNASRSPPTHLMPRFCGGGVDRPGQGFVFQESQDTVRGVSPPRPPHLPPPDSLAVLPSTNELSERGRAGRRGGDVPARDPARVLHSSSSSSSAFGSIDQLPWRPSGGPFWRIYARVRRDN